MPQMQRSHAVKWHLPCPNACRMRRLGRVNPLRRVAAALGALIQWRRAVLIARQCAIASKTLPNQPASMRALLRASPASAELACRIPSAPPLTVPRCTEIESSARQRRLHTCWGIIYASFL
ncbi:hypothetical protein FCM35_KLT17908 [Carex littledalei]|uniref:Uncharacterized protein n=1 Tax=Carex littledalei TaxID=544730 RepID=A0A833RDU4_9POAL|nr:hypothetical protein FCM35_KLT17908 [Carex littledalei]